MGPAPGSPGSNQYQTKGHTGPTSRRVTNGPVAAAAQTLTPLDGGLDRVAVISGLIESGDVTAAWRALKVSEPESAQWETCGFGPLEALQWMQQHGSGSVPWT